jgi:phosphatidylserine decarboxylase
VTSWFVALQKAVPQHGLSRLAGMLAASEQPLIKRTFIQRFAKVYDVNMAEAECDNLADFGSFNDFFTRALKPDVRPLADGASTVVCPADGAVSQIGDIKQGTLLQAKGHRYSLNGLAGSLSSGFEGGSFCTVYLAPKDYHRIHLPCAGTLTDSLAIPGALFSVNQKTEAGIEGLFLRNERLVCRFETAFGPMLVILVGAMIVASIETVWGGPQSPYGTEQHTEHNESFEKGAEIGRFLLGSTVICCFPHDSVNLDDSWQAGTPVRMGQLMAQMALEV